MRAKESLWSGLGALVAACGGIAAKWFDDKIPRAYSVSIAILGFVTVGISRYLNHRAASSKSRWALARLPVLAAFSASSMTM